MHRPDGWFGDAEGRGSFEGRPHTDPDVLSDPARPGDDACGTRAYFPAKGQEVVCASTQGALSSH
jgi:hypothetical protein